MAKTPIRIDGRKLEGGGQLVRNALCIAAMTGTPIKITNIRGNRSGGGGLGHQHLACVKWLASACCAQVKGAEKGSHTLEFWPQCADDPDEQLSCPPTFNKVINGDKVWYETELIQDTPGSTGLALQAILPLILFSKLPTDAPIRLTLTGGLNVSGSPSYEYITMVLLPTLRNLGFPEIRPQFRKRGWNRGDEEIGCFTLEIAPRKQTTLPAFNLHTPLSNAAPQRRRPHSIRAVFLGPNDRLLRCMVHDRLHKAIHRLFDGHMKVLANISSSDHPKRMYLILVATIPLSQPNEDANATDTVTTGKIAYDWLYDKRIANTGVAISELINRVTTGLAAELASGAPVDSHMRDQLVIFQALAQGTSVVSPGADPAENPLPGSLHTQTAIWIAEKMLQGVKFDGKGRCNGMGFNAEQHPEDHETDLCDQVRDCDPFS